MKLKFFILMFIISFSAYSYAEDYKRNSVPDSAVKPNRIITDSVFYLKLGYGSIINDIMPDGASFGLGYRYEMDKVGVDVSTVNLTIDTQDSKGYFFDLLRLQGIYFFDSESNSTFYIAGGMEYSFSMAENDDNQKYKGKGIGGIFSFGFETMRTSTIRLFIQLDVSFPIYSLEYEDKKQYSPVGVLSMGIGF